MGESFFCPARLIFSMPFSIACSQFSIRAGIENRELSQELRLGVDCQLTFERYCTLLYSHDTYCSGWRGVRFLLFASRNSSHKMYKHTLWKRMLIYF